MQFPTKTLGGPPLDALRVPTGKGRRKKRRKNKNKQTSGAHFNPLVTYLTALGTELILYVMVTKRRSLLYAGYRNSCLLVPSSFWDGRRQEETAMRRDNSEENQPRRLKNTGVEVLRRDARITQGSEIRAILLRHILLKKKTTCGFKHELRGC